MSYAMLSEPDRGRDPDMRGGGTAWSPAAVVASGSESFANLNEPGAGRGYGSADPAKAEGTISHRPDLPGSLSFAMTPAGKKIHRVGANGMTLCGFSTLQMVMVEDPLRRSLLCEWCVAA